MRALIATPGLLLVAAVAAATAVAQTPDGAPGDLTADNWLPLAEDGLHDADNPALEILQEPGAALSRLPPDVAGNMVRWVDALRDGYIQPRTNIYPETDIQILDSEVIMRRTGDRPWVVFPHRPHSEWLDCSNCHDAIFAREAGATPVSMLRILQGEYCGRCHGAVAFPLTECDRCHVLDPETAMQNPRPAAQPTTAQPAQ